jgi:flap endonuclease-1
MVGILVGTDYNPGGIKGVGPKNALKLVKEYKGRFDGMFEKLEWGKYFDFSWKEVYDLIKNMPVTDKYELKWKDINKEKIIGHLVDKHDFSLERVESTLEKLKKFGEQKKQTGLGAWAK